MTTKKPEKEPEKPQEPKKRGPEPDRLKIEGEWQDAVKKALEKERPKEGWPKPKKPG